MKRVSLYGLFLLCFLRLTVHVVHAQEAPLRDSLAAAIQVETSRYIDARTPVTITLNRPLARTESLALIIGKTDVTALAAQRPDGLTYDPRIAPLPSGEQEVTVYLREGEEWTRVNQVTIKVLTTRGFQRVTGSGGATVGNKGQLARGVDGAEPDGRATWQDVTLNTELGATIERPGFTTDVTTVGVGSSRREEALRYGLRADEAPRFDLSEYRVTLTSPTSTLAIGHVSFGESRYLLNGFAARGVTGAWSRGGTTLRVGTLGGAATVGWDQLLPVANADHRVMAASVRREVFAQRPGALRIDASWADASVLPRTGFTQGGIVDAEQSTGGSIQLNAALPGDRVRVAGGITRSRFINPPLDPQLGADTLLVRAEQDTRAARFLEVHLAPLQEIAVPRFGSLSASIVGRHERVDPLYRSAVTYVQSDRQQNGVDGTFALGALSAQVTISRSRDNLAAIPSLMTTRERNSTTAIALPVARLVKATRYAAWFPIVTWNAMRTHQRGDGVPAGNVFTPDQVPDQLSTNKDVALQWNAGGWSVMARRNRALQDNRQIGRSAADFASGSNALTIGRGIGAVGDVAIDLGDDFQESRERGERARTRRGTLSVNLRRGQSTSVVLAWSLLRTTPATGPATRNTEERAEVTQPINFFRGADGSARGQLFLRFGRSSALLLDFASDPLMTRRESRWALSSGLNLRLF